MLVLTRKTDQAVVHTLPDGQRITVTVLSVQGEKIRLGIDAPRDVDVYRGEVQAEIDTGAPRTAERAVSRSAQERQEQHDGR